VPIGVGTTRRTDRKRLKGESEEPILAAIATTAPIVGKKAREASREFEADRPGDFAQASNEQEEPSHGNALKIPEPPSLSLRVCLVALKVALC
jgi:hypothetical protein